MEERKRGPGRPRNAESPDRARREDAQKDEIIARCVNHLVWLGFPQRGRNGVYATVARCAFNALNRHNHADEPSPLRESQIERIYEDRVKQAQKSVQDQTYTIRDLTYLRGRKNFTKDSLQERVPYASGGNRRRLLSDLAQELLMNGGEPIKTPYDVVTDLDDNERIRYLEDMVGPRDTPELTPKAKSAADARPKITFEKKRGN